MGHMSMGSPGLDRSKRRAFLKDPLLKKTGNLLNLSINHLCTMTELLTGQCHLKGHLQKLALVNSPERDRCKQASEMASHVLGNCEALAALRFRDLG
jgi:hypothetical protein